MPTGVSCRGSFDAQPQSLGGAGELLVTFVSFSGSNARGHRGLAGTGAA